MRRAFKVLVVGKNQQVRGELAKYFHEHVKLTCGPNGIGVVYEANFSSAPEVIYETHFINLIIFPLNSREEQEGIREFLYWLGEAPDIFEAPSEKLSQVA